MKINILISLALLLCLTLATIDLSTTEDPQLGDLLTNNWYNILPAGIKTQKAELLKLLDTTNLVKPVIAHHSLRIRNRHMLKNNEPNF
jgi:hypothetical protein